MGKLVVGGGVNMRDYVWDEIEEENTGRDNWKGGPFQGQVKTWSKRNSHKCTRISPAKTPRNNGEGA